MSRECVHGVGGCVDARIWALTPLATEQGWGTEFTFGGGFENHFFIGSWTGIGHITFKQ